MKITRGRREYSYLSHFKAARKLFKHLGNLNFTTCLLSHLWKTECSDNRFTMSSLSQSDRIPDIIKLVYGRKLMHFCDSVSEK